MKAIEIKTIQVVFPLNSDSEQDNAELHIEADDNGESVAIIQRFTKAEWESISKGRGYWHGGAA